jgi:hypothetical protein
MAADMTVLFYTANRTPAHFMAHVRRLLLDAIGDLPLVSVSQQPMPDFGRNVCVGDIGQAYLNIYRQLQVGAQAITTPYIAFAEDDILYPPSHFTAGRAAAQPDAFAYDMHKWSLYTWVRPPIFNLKLHGATTGCIAPRALLLAALEERFARWPGDSAPLKYWGEFGRYERQLGVTVQRVIEFRAPDPHVVFSHADAIGYQYLGTLKRMGAERMPAIPYWGPAADVMRLHHA